MNRKVYASILALSTCLALGFLAACGGSSKKTTTTTPPPTTTVAIAATSGGGQSATVSTAFAQPLVVTVTSNGSAASGVTVTFTAPSSGASGTFANGTATETDTTSSSGVAKSLVFTANATAGAYAVTASATGATATASFSLTNTSTIPVSTNNTYVYYASGQEPSSTVTDQYYAVAGAVTLDSAGDIIGGEQDYNDGVSNTSPGEPSTPDTIAPGATALVVDPTTGLGTLAITLNNTNLGVGGKELFDVQFVNANHALIVQADGSATASGSLDLQTATSTSGNFAFAVSGVNPTTDSVAFGGVFTAASGGATGTIDINDADGGVSPTNAFTTTTTAPDAFGRSVVTGISNVAYATFQGSPAPINFVTYAVGPEAIRIIDVDTTDTAVGSAFGQGSATFTNTSLTSGVFSLLGQWSEQYGTLGQFTTDTNGDGGFAAGTADDNELSNGIEVENTQLLGSTYDLTSGPNGYGTVSLNFQTSAANVSSLGLYMTDPALNLNDPNNTTTDLGGALLADMDPSLPGGIGVIIPQTDTTATDFNGNYAAGFQDFNYFSGTCGGCEFDMLGPITLTAGALSTASIGADDSDPLDTITGAESTGDTYSSTPTAVSPGYFSMSSLNLPAPGNPLNATIDGSATPFSFDTDIYQASATTLYWLNFGSAGVQETLFLGSIEAQPSGTTFPGTKRPAARAQAKRK